MPTPEARREERKKFDRHEAYVYLHLGMWPVAVGIVMSDVPSNSAVATLSWHTQQLLGMCMMIGSASGLFGIALGSRYFRPDTYHHPLDVRYPYAFGLGSMLGIGISMWGYFIVIFMSSNVIGTLGGGLSLAFGVMCIHMAVRFFHQIVIRTRMRNVLTRRAIRDRDGEEEQT